MKDNAYQAIVTVQAVHCLYITNVYKLQDLKQEDMSSPIDERPETDESDGEIHAFARPSSCRGKETAPGRIEQRRTRKREKVSLWLDLLLAAS